MEEVRAKEGGKNKGTCEDWVPGWGEGRKKKEKWRGYWVHGRKF